ncbi:EAL domain-containing protein [Chitinibacter bivalviorum]|uniref:EAL domain-containing protein n=1 Tax=Chitinibacter bivalviorum TaxID=2739434 RepID=A0A7H9BDN8_9NEIS|nr:EAL domain-containing protein [Chitinibacter bivalviorum]QLG86823.1 EAL domain-containing protein [Chitinibacter bivalviorum]
MPEYLAPMRSKPFNLIRYFFLLSLGIMSIATLLMTGYLQHYSSEQLLKLEKVRASSMVQVFENSLWPQFRPLTLLDKTQLLKQSSQGQLMSNVIQLMKGTDVIKIKVYALNGLTVFSTDPKQVGEVEEDNDGFKSALANVPASELAHKHSIDSFERALVDRDVISTYVPVHGANEKVEGVLEIYVDATPFIKAMSEQLRWLAVAICFLMVILFLVQMLVVMRAGNIINKQAAELEEANRDLDRRVEERTFALGQANLQLEAEVIERRNAEERLDQLAHHDPLTNLPNRLLFNEQLEQRLLQAPDHPHHLAVLFIDLDRFKDVNDTLGHFIGDQLLIAVTARLIKQVRADDTLARLGGDEFVCILNTQAGRETASQIAGQLLALFSQPFHINNNDIFLSASIGISFAPEDGMDVNTLVRNADIAMYQAKAAGRNRFQCYTRAMSVAAEERVRIERYLRQAIEHNELTVHFQAKVDSNSGQLVGAEALARWHSEALGHVPPVRFIPVAEDTGLIVALGDQILEKTCQQLRDWRSSGFNIPCVSVNLSVKQLERTDFPAHLAQLLHLYQLPATALELEITESVIMAVDDAIETLDAIRALGVKLSIDDFGTGYSSLAYLKQLPVQVLKIDRAFILGIGSGKDNEAIIRTIISLASSLGLSTVAEGVEEATQIRFLQEEGCSTIQGFYYGKPLPAAAFHQQWRSNTRPPITELHASK